MLEQSFKSDQASIADCLELFGTNENGLDLDEDNDKFVNRSINESLISLAESNSVNDDLNDAFIMENSAILLKGSPLVD